MNDELLPFIKHLSQLKGRIIVDIARDGGSEYTKECCGLMLDDGSTAWIMSDPEGNGPGFLDIEKEVKG